MLAIAAKAKRLLSAEPAIKGYRRFFTISPLLKISFMCFP